jgi:hypothetical protein
MIVIVITWVKSFQRENPAADIKYRLRHWIEMVKLKENIFFSFFWTSYKILLGVIQKIRVQMGGRGGIAKWHRMSRGGGGVLEFNTWQILTTRYLDFSN